MLGWSFRRIRWWKGPFASSIVQWGSVTGLINSIKLGGRRRNYCRIKDPYSLFYDVAEPTILFGWAFNVSTESIIETPKCNCFSETKGSTKSPRYAFKELTFELPFCKAKAGTKVGKTKKESPRIRIRLVLCTTTSTTFSRKKRALAKMCCKKGWILDENVGLVIVVDVLRYCQGYLLGTDSLL